ncbi:MAG: TolC family protein [Bacteroidota bacterium]
MRRIMLFAGILFFVSGAAAQSLSLDSCVAWAKQNYPAIKQNQLTLLQTAQNEKALNENWLPKINFQGQATYNTEVVQFNFPGMDIKFPHDAYMTALNLEQTLVDGGSTKSQKHMESISAELELQKNEVEMYKIVERINQLYVNILLGRENVKILSLYKEDLDNRRRNIQIAVDNQTVLESALDELDAEILKTEQSLIESTFSLSALYKTLSFFTGRNMDDKTVLLETPLGGPLPKLEITRPELRIFDLQSQLLERRYALTNSFALPKVTLGATGNYGRPGPNFINQDLRFFASANLTVRWNVSSLYGLKRERTKLKLNQDLLDVQRELFLYNLQASINTQSAQIESLNQVIEKDETIISKRHNVTLTATSQMENGKIKVADYLTQLNAELQAQLNKKVHEVKLMNAISSINATSGSFKF